MMKSSNSYFRLCGVGLLLTLNVHAENWPGLNGGGSAANSSPTAIGTNINVKWMLRLDPQTYSSRGGGDASDEYAVGVQVHERGAEYRFRACTLVVQRIEPVLYAGTLLEPAVGSVQHGADEPDAGQSAGECVHGSCRTVRRIVLSGYRNQSVEVAGERF